MPYGLRVKEMSGVLQHSCPVRVRKLELQPMTGLCLYDCIPSGAGGIALVVVLL